MARRPFHVLLTSYEILMGAQDRPRLSRITWQGVVVDEGHRYTGVGGSVLGSGRMCLCVPGQRQRQAPQPYVETCALMLTASACALCRNGHPSPDHRPPIDPTLAVRLKNAGCKLSQELRMFKAKSRLLLTGANHVLGARAGLLGRDS